MPEIRIFFADDQIPWNDPARDELVFDEINKEKGEALKALGMDPRKAFEEDKEWFSGLLHYLESTYSLKIESERVYRNAVDRLEDPSKYSAAVIDLSWSGDGTLPLGRRSNVGLQLIDRVNKSRHPIPVIAFSQNFASNRELMSQVTSRNAFPMQKNYNELDYQALGAAILYLTRHERAKVDIPNHAVGDVKKIGRTFWDFIGELPKALIPLTLIGLFVAALAFAQANTKPGEAVKVFEIPIYTKAK
jgi:hypothetical protein